MRPRLPLLVALGLLAPGLALAQGAPAAPPAFTRVAGVVTALDNGGLTVKAADGTETKLGVGADLSLVTTRVVDADTIQPGTFVATANENQADGTGKSTELRVFEPGVRLGEGSRPMAQPGVTMTNATVTKVTKTAAGHELDVAFPGGVRHIVLPTSVPVIASIPLDPSGLKVGANVVAIAQKGQDGALRAQRITVNPAAATAAR